MHLSVESSKNRSQKRREFDFCRNMSDDRLNAPSWAHGLFEKIAKGEASHKIYDPRRVRVFGYQSVVQRTSLGFRRSTLRFWMRYDLSISISINMTYTNDTPQQMDDDTLVRKVLPRTPERS